MIRRKLKLSFVVLVATVLAAGTFFEKWRGSAFAHEHIYGSWWFAVMLGAVGVWAIYAIVRRKLWRTIPLFLIHAAIPVILIGGAATSWTGTSGTITLQPGVPVTSCQLTDGTSATLPFAITLRGFEVVPYPGTNTPMDFVSHIEAAGEYADISMNNIYRRSGYRFYQSDFSDDGSSILTVTHDPVGIAITYCGYLLMLTGLVFFGISRLSADKAGKGCLSKCRKKKGGDSIRRVSAALLLLAAGFSCTASPRALPRDAAEEMGRMYMLYNGRVCPVQTFARDFTLKLTGKTSWQGYTAEQVLSGFLFYFDDWANEPLIKVKGGEVKRVAGIEGKRASFMQLASFDADMVGPSSDKNLRAAIEKAALVRMLLSGRHLKIYPVGDSAAVTWYAQNDELPLTLADDEYIFIRKQLGYCQELVLQRDFETLAGVFSKTRLWQEKQAEGLLPSKASENAERIYNRLSAGRWIAMLAVALGLLAFGTALAQSFTLQSEKTYPKGSENNAAHTPVVGIKKRKWLGRFYYVVAALLVVWLLLIFFLRWVAGGHVPMAGSYDTMSLMAIVIGLLSVLLARRHPMMLPAGLLAMGFCMLVAMMSGSNPPVTNLMPVLNSPLLALHVAVIMAAYALFLFITMMSVAGLVQRHSTEMSVLIYGMTRKLLYAAVSLLATGILIGAVWANVSWGTYWSWDPKEVWALITLIVYIIPLHTTAASDAADRNQSGEKLAETSRRHFYLYLVVAILSVAFTYFGVNALLGGLHSYR